jgi:hypothetical protein
MGKEAMMQFHAPELDVLLYLASYLDVYGTPPTADHVRQSVQEPSAVNGLIRAGYLSQDGGFLILNQRKVYVALVEQLRQSKHYGGGSRFATREEMDYLPASALCTGERNRSCPEDFSSL